MHSLHLPSAAIARSIENRGVAHVFGELDPARTALIVIDMQNYFVAPGYLGEVSTAHEIVPAINRLAAAIREVGGRVVWVQNRTNDTRESWSTLHDHLMTPERRARRWATMDESDPGFSFGLSSTRSPRMIESSRNATALFFKALHRSRRICGRMASIRF